MCELNESVFQLQCRIFQALTSVFDVRSLSIKNFIYAERHLTKDMSYANSGELPYETKIVVDLDNMIPVDFTPYNWFHGAESITGYGEYGATEYPRVVEPKIFFTK